LQRLCGCAGHRIAAKYSDSGAVCRFGRSDYGFHTTKARVSE